MQIKENQRIAIIKYIINQPFFLGQYGEEEGGIVDFLELIWELHTMPSMDDRFQSAYEDAWQHLVRNYDWDYEYVFTERFPSTYKDEEVFKKFISFSVHPSLFPNEDQRRQLVEAINTELAKYGYRLTGTDYFEQRIVYSITLSTDVRDQLPEDIAENTIPVYFGNDVNRNYPCLELEPEGWNDWFSYKTKFTLVYYETANESRKIGYLKLMKRGTNETATVLPKAFVRLTEDWCSIGMEYSYYETIKGLFGTQYQSVLYALRDTAVFPSIYELFEDDPIYNNSLIRQEPYHSNPAPLLDSVRWRLQGVNVESYYKFKYSFRPSYSLEDIEENYTTLDFDFAYDVPFEQRIYGIIGKNGSGKTTMLSKMATSFQSAGDKRIMPRKPLYNKVISISFSVFDTFPLPVGDARFNYRYLGLRDKKGDMLQILRAELRTHLIGINNKSRMRQWFSFLREVLHEQLAGILTQDGYFDKIDVDKVMSYLEKLSSGENLLIYIFSSLLDEIKQNTLILFDEPEMHLHPNAISSLIQYMYRLLDHFNSFCIMATHSPLVIQEIPSDNVIIFRREGNSLEVQPLAYETFSQDLTTVTESVFGDTSANRYHYRILRYLASTVKDYEKILGMLNNSGRPVPFGTRMLLKTMLDENHAQS